MSKIFRYFKLKTTYFVQIYFYLFILISFWDNKSVFPAVLYSVGLFLILENFQVFFDFNYQNGQPSQTSLVDLLPIEKKKYQMAQTGIVIAFILLNTLILILARNILPQLFMRTYINRSTDVLYLVQFYWIFITLIYLCFHIWETYFEKDKVKIASARMVMLFSTTMISALAFIYSIPNEYTNRSVISGWESIAFLIGGILFFIIVLLFGKRVIERFKPQQFKVSAYRWINIKKCSRYQVGKIPVEVSYAGGFIGFFSSIVLNNTGFNEYILLTISLLALFLAIHENVKQYFRSGNLLKILPFSKKEIYYTSILNILMDWLLYTFVFTAIVLAIISFKGGSVRFEISLGFLIMFGLFHLVVFWIGIKSFLNQFGIFYGMLGGFIVVFSLFGMKLIIELFSLYKMIGLILMFVLLVVIGYSLKNEYKDAMLK